MMIWQTSCIIIAVIYPLFFYNYTFFLIQDIELSKEINESFKQSSLTFSSYEYEFALFQFNALVFIFVSGYTDL